MVNENVSTERIELNLPHVHFYFKENTHFSHWHIICCVYVVCTSTFNHDRVFAMKSYVSHAFQWENS